LDALYQVFEPDQFDSLFDQVKKCFDAGTVPFARLKLKVLANETQGVQGGYTADMLWVFNGGREAWEGQLADEAKEVVNEKLGKFPFISTFKLDYEPELVGCLSNLACHNMLQLEEELKSLVPA
jgi:hypothetical protein